MKARDFLKGKNLPGMNVDAMSKADVAKYCKAMNYDGDMDEGDDDDVEKSARDSVSLGALTQLMKAMRDTTALGNDAAARPKLADGEHFGDLTGITGGLAKSGNGADVTGFLKSLADGVVEANRDVVAAVDALSADFGQFTALAIAQGSLTKSLNDRLTALEATLAKSLGARPAPVSRAVTAVAAPRFADDGHPGAAAAAAPQLTPALVRSALEKSMQRAVEEKDGHNVSAIAVMLSKLNMPNPQFSPEENAIFAKSMRGAGALSAK
jgi:hypothetical protein